MQSINSNSKLSKLTLLALALNCGIALSYILLWYIAAKDDLLWAADFTAFYTSGAIVRDGLGDQLYNMNTQALYQQNILQGLRYGSNVLLYINPPYAALPFVPLTLLSLQGAYILWSILQVLLLIAAVAMLVRLTKHWHPHERWLLVSTCLALPGVLRSFLLGAFSIFMLVCLLGWVASLKRGNNLSVASWLLLGTFKPQIIIGPSLICLIGRQWKIITYFITGGSALFIIPIIMFGWEIWLGFIKLLSASGSFYDAYGINPASMYNLRGTLTLWLGNGQADLINLASFTGFLFGLLLTVWLWRGKWDPHQPVFNLRLSFTLLYSTLFSLHVYMQDGVLLAIPGFLLFEYLLQRDLPRRSLAIFAACCPSIFLLDEFYLSAWLPIRLAVVAMMIILVWSGILLRRENLRSK